MASAQTPPVVFVDATATGANDGSSWANAYVDLQAALDDPNVPSHEVWVAAGTYKPSKLQDPSDPRSATFTIGDGAIVVGGFAGTEACRQDRNALPLPQSTLDGNIGSTVTSSDNAYHVVTLLQGEVDGFTIQNGNANATGSNQDDGGGVILRPYSKTILIATGPPEEPVYEEYTIFCFPAGALFNCIVQHNQAIGRGAGLYMVGGGGGPLQGSLFMKWCVFVENGHASGSSNSGGGMFLEKAPYVVVHNTKFIDNLAAQNGGGVGVSKLGTHVGFFGCDFYDNAAGLMGGGAHVAGNSGVQSRAGWINCTIAYNSAGQGGGIRCGAPQYSGSGSFVNNTIVWENTAATDAGLSGSHSVAHSDTQGGVQPGTGNISADPKFVNGAGGNLRLVAGSSPSPAINAGDNAQLPNDVLFLDYPPNGSDVDPTDCLDETGDVAEILPIDLDRERRVVNTTVDMGAHEWP